MEDEDIQDMAYRIAEVLNENGIDVLLTLKAIRNAKLYTPPHSDNIPLVRPLKLLQNIVMD